jgi:hypothetical protein
MLAIGEGLKFPGVQGLGNACHSSFLSGCATHFGRGCRFESAGIPAWVEDPNLGFGINLGSNFRPRAQSMVSNCER